MSRKGRSMRSTWVILLHCSDTCTHVVWIFLPNLCFASTVPSWTYMFVNSFDYSFSLFCLLFRVDQHGSGGVSERS